MPVLVPHTQIHSQKLLRHLYAKLALKPKHYTADCSLSYDLSRYKWGEHNVGNKVQSITALKGWESLCMRICDWALWWCPERASWRFSRTSYLHFSQWESGPVSLPRQPPHLTINSSLDAAYVPATAPSIPYFSEYYNISFTSPYCTILFWLHLSLSHTILSLLSFPSLGFARYSSLFCLQLHLDHSFIWANDRLLIINTVARVEQPLTIMKPVTRV